MMMNKLILDFSYLNVKYEQELMKNYNLSVVIGLRIIFLLIFLFF